MFCKLNDVRAAKIQTERELHMGIHMNNEFIGRRTGRERRTERFGDLRWFLKTGRRRHVRRQVDRRRLHMLDYYPPKLFFRNLKCPTTFMHTV